jgi:hypothetical protein
MSIKTTKRLALGVIASLVFAPLVAVAPANAAALTSTTAQSVTVLVGTSSTLGTFTFAGFDDGAADTIAVGTVSGPTGGTVTFSTVNGAVVAGGGGTVAVNVNATGTLTEQTNNAFGALAAAATGKALVGQVNRPGTYTMTIGGATLTIVARSLAYTTGDGPAVSPWSTGAGVAGPANTVTVTGNTTGVANVRALVTVSGAGATIQSATNSNTVANTALTSTVIDQTAASAIVIRTPEVGTITVSLFNETAANSGLFSTTAANTVTITVRSAATTNVYSASNSSVLAIKGSGSPINLTDATGANATSEADAVSTPALIAATSAGTVEALGIQIDQEDANDANLTTAVRNEISISPIGAVGVAVDAPLGSYATETAQNSDFYVFADGRSGRATVTVTVGGVVAKTYTVIFFGAVASYTLTTTNAIIAAGDSADAQVLTVRALDANSQAIPNATVHVSSGTTTVATVDSATVTTGAAGEAADIGVNGIAAGTSVITVGNAASSPTVSATATITIAAAGISTVSLAFDKTSYLPGERATITITLRNASAALVGDFAYTNVFAAGGIVPSSNLTTDMTAMGVTSVNGVKTFTVFMPLIEGPVSVSATLGTGVATAAQATVVTASTTVARPKAPEPEPVYEKPTLSFVVSGDRVFLSGTAADGEGDIIIYVKRVGTTAWKERAKTLEVAAPGDFNGSIKAPRGNVVIRVKQEGTGLFSNQVIIVK